MMHQETATEEDKRLLADAMRLPHAEPGMAIGLFGGSFNPPHAGHVHVSETALIRGRLDQVWWLVTPGNPLKDHSELEGLAARIRASRRLIADPRILVTAFEAAHDLHYTEETLALVRHLRPRNRFVWIMGADNLAGFHRWQNWRRIAAMMPLMVIDRPGSTLSVLSAPAAISLARYRVDERLAPRLAGMAPPAWTFIHAPRSAMSSSAIRRNRNRATRIDRG